MGGDKEPSYGTYESGCLVNTPVYGRDQQVRGFSQYLFIFIDPELIPEISGLLASWANT